MEKQQITRWFLGANSGNGFSSLYEGFCRGDGDFLRVIKGGPGCGKSTFMRRIGEAAEARGLEVEYILCSGDPDSLDAILLPGKKAALVDGTAPHDTAPLGHPAKKVRICKGLRDQLLDGTSTGHGYLGHFCRTSYLIRGVTAQK